MIITLPIDFHIFQCTRYTTNQLGFKTTIIFTEEKEAREANDAVVGTLSDRDLTWSGKFGYPLVMSNIALETGH